MELGGGFRVKGRGRVRSLNGMSVRLDSGSHLVIELPASWILRYVSISAFFAAVILALPFVGLILQGSLGNCLVGVDTGVGSELMSSFELVETLIEDLSREGLVTEVNKALIVGASNMGDVGEGLWFRSGNELHLAEESHLMDRSLIPDEMYDFALVSSSLDAKSVDRVMKVGGIVAARMMTDCWNEFLGKSNYKIVYLRNLEPAVVAARKIRPFSLDKRVVSLATRRLCEVTPEAKEADSRDLADSLLEPLSRWTMFYNRYPRRNLPFGDEEITSGDASRPLNFPDWQMDNVEEGEHVMTNAQAEAVEEILKNRAIPSADELFVECYRQWGIGDDEKSRKRTFWECMSLYGRLKNGGVAVHQWWEWNGIEPFA